MTLLTILVPFGTVAVVIAVAATVFKLWYRRLPEGQALVISDTTGTRACLDGGGLILPVVARAEVVDLTVKALIFDRCGAESLRCKDGFRADLRLVFFVRVEPTVEGVLRVAQEIGCARAAELETLKELFQAQFMEQAKQAAAARRFAELFLERSSFKQEILAGIGRELRGYVVDSVVIDHLARTGIEHLDASNPLEAEAHATMRPDD